MPSVRPNQLSRLALKSGHEGFELPVDGGRSKKLSVETCSESNLMSRQDPVLILKNLNGQAFYGEIRCARTGKMWKGDYGLSFTIALFLHAEIA